MIETSINTTAQFEKELNPEERKIAKSIEEFKWLETRDKVFILLIRRKLKSASPVSIFSASPHATQDMERLLENAKLLYKAGPTITAHMRGLNPGMIYYVANNQADLELLSELWLGDHHKDPYVYKNIGRMCGFPASSIDTYDKFSQLKGKEQEEAMQKLVLSPEEKARLFSAEVLPFSLSFHMSRHGREQEVKTVERWAQEVKLVSPKIFQQFIDTYKKK